MILCIKVDAIKTNKDIQRDIDVTKLLTESTQYFNTPEEALERGYVPLDFSVSIRSAYTNFVVETKPTEESNDPEEKRYYINMTKVDILPHRGVDLIMYLSSVGIMSCVTYTPLLDKVMMKSQFCPIGLYNPDPSLLNPIMYSHVILMDETIEDFRTLLREDINLVSIEDMKRHGNLDALLETIILVKGEEKNESADNNDN